MRTNSKQQQMLTSTPIELKICANPEYLAVARILVRKVAQLVGLENKDDLVTLAVEEALTNVIRHGYGGPCDKPIILRLNRIYFGDEKKAALEIVIRDFGRQVEPASIKGGGPGQLRAGGFGVHIINSVMDQVELSRGDDCGMELRLVKRIT